MHLVQILLPLADNDGQVFPKDLYTKVSHELAERFGGVTAYTRSPAEGQWRQEGFDPHLDEVIVVEVMVAKLDEAWWSTYRASLESAFRQKQIIVRAQPIRVL